jgi:hypothetical protein
MGLWSSDNFGADNFRALTFGLPSALAFPDIDALPDGDTPAVGWYASDNGLVRRWGGYKRKDSSDFRRYFLDLSPLTEIRAGDTIAEVPEISILAAPNSISAGNYFAAGDRVYFTLGSGVPNNIYALTVSCKLTSGTRISRVVRVALEEYV